MIRIILRVIGIVFVLLGIVLGIAPIPIGWLMMLIGLMFLIPTTPSVVRLIKGMRRRSSTVDKAFTGLARRAPTPYRRVLKETEVTDTHLWR